MPHAFCEHARVRVEVRVREDRAFRLAGRAARVELQRVGFELGQPGSIEVRGRARPWVDLRAALFVREPRREIGRDEDRLRVRIVEKISYFRRRMQWREHEDARAGEPCAEKRRDEGRAGRDQDRDALSLPVAESGGDPLRVLGDAGVRVLAVIVDDGDAGAPSTSDDECVRFHDDLFGRRAARPRTSVGVYREAAVAHDIKERLRAKRRRVLGDRLCDRVCELHEMLRRTTRVRLQRNVDRCRACKISRPPMRSFRRPRAPRAASARSSLWVEGERKLRGRGRSSRAGALPSSAMRHAGVSPRRALRDRRAQLEGIAHVIAEIEPHRFDEHDLAHARAMRCARASSRAPAHRAPCADACRSAEIAPPLPDTMPRTHDEIPASTARARGSSRPDASALRSGRYASTKRRSNPASDCGPRAAVSASIQPRHTSSGVAMDAPRVEFEGEVEGDGRRSRQAKARSRTGRGRGRSDGDGDRPTARSTTTGRRAEAACGSKRDESGMGFRMRSEIAVGFFEDDPERTRGREIGQRAQRRAVVGVERGSPRAKRRQRSRARLRFPRTQPSRAENAIVHRAFAIVRADSRMTRSPRGERGIDRIIDGVFELAAHRRLEFHAHDEHAGSREIGDPLRAFLFSYERGGSDAFLGELFGGLRHDDLTRAIPRDARIGPICELFRSLDTSRSRARER